MRILTSDEVRHVEREAISRPGGSALVLMQRAGRAVAQFCLANFKFDSVCVVCGKGNNGGDGLVAAEALRPVVKDISVIILAGNISDLSPDAAAMCARLKLKPIWMKDEAAFESDAVREALRADLIIDAVLGTGFKPPLRGLAKRAVDAMNDAFRSVVAIDLPSGVDADMNVAAHGSHVEMARADGIITFIAPKPAHAFGELTAGPIALSDLSVQAALPPSQTGLSVTTGEEVDVAFPPRPHDANKGQFGHVMVIAGSLGKAGAAGLAAMAALRAGAGLVTVACPKSIQSVVASFAPELMTEGLPETPHGTLSGAAGEVISALMKGKDTVVLGPGLSRNTETEEFVRHFVAACSLPLVLDADGLNAFEGRARELASRGNAAPFCVLTPHPGEASRLLGVSVGQIQEKRLEMARRLAKETNCCALLKGWHTVIAGLSGETWINMTGNPALAKGGSGDVLSGIIGAAIARRAASQRYNESSGSPIVSGQEAQVRKSSAQISALLNDVAVAAAVYLHGFAADKARDRLQENTVLASDVLANLGSAFRDCDLQVESGLFYVQR